MYYEKDGEKSNMVNALGIFQGKKRTYNKLILKALLYGGKNTKQLSLYISQNLGFKERKNWKSVFSVIDRPKSRLWELSTKGYIEKKEGRWQLTLKGFCVALTLFKSLDEAKRVIPIELFSSALKDVVENIVKSPRFAPFRTPYIDDKVKEMIVKVKDDSRFGELFLLKLRDYTSELIAEGVNLDDLGYDRFMWLLAVKMAGWFFEYIS